jgi:hypothetical protein
LTVRGAGSIVPAAMLPAVPDTAARVILAAAFLPFAWFAARDFRLHVTARRVSMAENVLHLALGVMLAAVLARAFRFEGMATAFAVLVFAVFGAADEFVFHRGLPAEEHDVHAKEHFALFVFMAVFGALLHLRARS